ncbi:MAG: hypothetical protein K6G83_14555, partial [Lachnospiraceae bacterium]|nr:hypothetical protein [Lachnospiraceae bacterium]
TMKSAVNGYSLAKGEITTEDYGNLMAEDIMMTIMAIPHPAMILALLPVTKVVMLAGCMAGGIVAGAGYLLAKDAVMDIVDGGGFEAIVPEGSVKNAVSIAKDMVASMNLEERLSGLKDMVVTTAGTGLITIRAAE